MKPSISLICLLPCCHVHIRHGTSRVQRYSHYSTQHFGSDLASSRSHPLEMHGACRRNWTENSRKPKLPGKQGSVTAWCPPHCACQYILNTIHRQSYLPLLPSPHRSCLPHSTPSTLEHASALWLLLFFIPLLTKPHSFKLRLSYQSLDEDLNARHQSGISTFLSVNRANLSI